MPFADNPPQPPISLAVPVLSQATTVPTGSQVTAVPTASQVTAVPTVLQLTAERVRVDPGQQMGLAGLHYLRPLGDVASGATPAAAGGQAYGGLSVFGATHGDRGGFFGWGISAGYRWQRGPWSAEAGGFVGGGGGSPAWVGGGLMLRPHIAVAHAWGPLSLGLGVAQVWFPNGQVRSTQPQLIVRWADSAFTGPSAGAVALDRPAVTSLAVEALTTETAAVIGQYQMHGRPARRDGTGSAPPLRYGGLVVRRALPAGLAGLGSVQPYWLLSAAGSLTAAYAGYAELLGGVGALWDLPPALGLPLALRAEVALGSGGAGALADTGGGLLRRAAGGLTWQIGPQLSLSAMRGRLASAGRFNPTETRFELAYRGWDGLPGAAPRGGPPPVSLAWVPWQVSAGWAQYPQVRRDDGRTAGLGVATLKLSRVLPGGGSGGQSDRRSGNPSNGRSDSPSDGQSGSRSDSRSDSPSDGTPPGPGATWRLVAQAAIATNGAAGGYATGQLGLGWLSAPLGASPWRVGAEASVGAAGGGSVQVGGGLIGQAQLQARYTLSPQWALQADAGWLRSRHGALSTPLIGLSAVYSFSRLQGP